MMNAHTTSNLTQTEVAHVSKNLRDKYQSVLWNQQGIAYQIMTNLRKLITRKCLLKVFLLMLLFVAVHHFFLDTTFYFAFPGSRHLGSLKSNSVWATYEHSRSLSHVRMDTVTTTALRSKKTQTTSTLVELEYSNAKSTEILRIPGAEVKTGNNNYSKNDSALPINNYTFLHVLLITYPRSGSSFVGKLLQSPKLAFYHFEPVHYLFDAVKPRKIRKLRPPSVRPVYRAQTPQEFLHDVFHCKYSQRFMQWAEIRSNYKTLERNERYWKNCVRGKNDSKLCYNASQFRRVCSKYPMQVVKTIRMSMKSVQELLEKYGDLNLKIIHLVRDPRGTMNSRSKKPIVTWCRKDINCYSPRVFCAGLDSDLTQSEQLQQKYPNKYLILRYEDLCCDMFHQTKEIFKFLGFRDLPLETVDFLNSHNLAMVQNNTIVKEKYLEPSYTTVRNSVQTAFAWRQELKFSHVKVIQMHCEVVMRKLGYVPLTKLEEMKNTTVRSISNTTECDPW